MASNVSPTTELGLLRTGMQAVVMDFREYAETSTAVETSSQAVSMKFPPRALCGANAMAWTMPSREPSFSLTRPGRFARCSAFVASSSMTSAGFGRRSAIFVVMGSILPNELSSTSAPCSWASLAAEKAIDASVKTPVIRTFLPSKIPTASPTFC